LYDALYQLVGENVSPAVYRWSYDSIGNRTGASVGGSSNAYTYFHNGSNPLNGQRLQSDGTSTWTYDDAGNTLTQQSSSLSLGFEYDVENRTSAISGSVAAAYAYDYQGRRTSKTVGGVTTTYLYDGLNLVAETTNGQTSHFLNGPGIDEPLAMAKSGGLSYFSVDALGSVVTTSDPAGVVTHSVRYDAWGKVRTETGARTHPFTYTGREVGEAGMLFYRARFYQPGIGRFSQEDPLAWFAALNENGNSRSFSAALQVEPQGRDYRYVENDPIAYVDPSGLWKVPSPSCFYWFTVCVPGAEDCRRRWCAIFRDLPPEDQQPYFDAVQVSGEAGFYSKVCFFGRPSCRTFFEKCGNTPLSPPWATPHHVPLPKGSPKAAPTPGPVRR